ncbi:MULTISPECIES: GNAT family N-acetyltransferase [Trichocoleus]|uniref:GNAT family N-acetyltransferase n=1 Tax=Trichocoleus desertorum GB2-A4 TaxID=2933944 RepID=A0ABV0J4K4_9CYAN|nr:GNAT family N-acetyltransferase [Trichocoleus sp. FACHB-46]MBD1862055.1 GNAT family N-acetyltransferase [Trichocoleus sp. FACHB-46]
MTGYELETERLQLRLLAIADLEAHHRQITANPYVMKTLPSSRPLTWERGQAVLTNFIDHWQHHGFGLWAMVEKQHGELIGHCGLQWLQNTSEVELAYAIAHDYWNKGLTTEAARASVRFGFETLQLQRIVSIALPTNLASQRVMQKAGLKYEKRAHYYNLEVAYYSLNREDYQPDDSFYRLRSAG